MRIKFIPLFLLITILTSNYLFSQKVGLVLSGGGAKGLAHIGVIKALEENNIPIDYIAGTSMGAIVGGLYAIGYTPEEMTALVTSQDFSNWANGKIDQKYLFLKNDAQYPEWFNFKVEIEDSVPKAKIPSNFVATHLMDFQFMKYLSPAIAAANYNFDSLFVPFRCVGTDITHNREVVFKKGSLSKAIRASMTFPFYYKPIKEDSIVYFDGGMVNNFPYKTLLNDFDVDFLIGSKTADNAPAPDTDDVINQIRNIMLGQTKYELPDSNSFLIDINLDSASLFNFKKSSSIITKGYKAALENIDSLSELIERKVTNTELDSLRKGFKEKFSPLVFEDINIQGLNKKQKKYVHKFIANKKKEFTLDEFREDYFKLILDDNISSVFPTAIYNSNNGNYDLNLNVDQQSQFLASLGGNISSSSINQGFGMLSYNHLGRYSKKITANVFYGRLYSSAMVSGRIVFPGAPKFFFKSELVLNRWDFYSSSREVFFEDVRPSYLIKNENYTQHEIGFPVRYLGNLRLGIQAGSLTSKYYLKEKFYKTDTADYSNFHYLNPYLIFEKNTFNYKQYPTRGSHFLFSASFINGREKFTAGNHDFIYQTLRERHKWFHVKLKYKTHLNFSEHFTLGMDFQGEFSNQNFFSNYYSTIVYSSWFNPTPHSQTIFLKNYAANKYIATGLTPIIEFNEKIHLRVSAYGFLPYRQIFKDENHLAAYKEPFENYYFMGHAGLVYHTVFGPASLNINYYNKENKKFFFLFNFGFILFNNSAIN